MARGKHARWDHVVDFNTCRKRGARRPINKTHAWVSMRNLKEQYGKMVSTTSSSRLLRRSATKFDCDGH
jgi:hypothetical protein